MGAQAKMLAVSSKLASKYAGKVVSNPVLIPVALAVGAVMLTAVGVEALVDKFSK